MYQKPESPKPRKIKWRKRRKDKNWEEDYEVKEKTRNKTTEQMQSNKTLYVNKNNNKALEAWWKHVGSGPIKKKKIWRTETEKGIKKKAWQNLTNHNQTKACRNKTY